MDDDNTVKMPRGVGKSTAGMAEALAKRVLDSPFSEMYKSLAIYRPGPMMVATPKTVWPIPPNLDFDDLFGDIKPASEYEPDWVISEDDEECDGCNGEGVYVGFRTIEDPCKKCNGCGRQKKETT